MSSILKYKKIYKKELRQKGSVGLLFFIIETYLNLLTSYYIKAKNKNKTFIFKKRKFHYFYHYRNTTWQNERAVEIAIFKDILEKNKNKNILEIGNVLSQYIPISHSVIDKYEEAEGVINQDASTFHTKDKYDLIISISTLEHIGWDEKQKDKHKVLKAVANMKKHMRKNGKLIASIPLGYNPFLDDLIKQKNIHFHKVFFLKRIAKDIWQETNLNSIGGVKYDAPFQKANGIAIIEV